MPELAVIEGEQSPCYNIYDSYTFESCIATDTRLMGVIAVKLTLRGRKNPDELMVVLMHLDYSEYGVDEYREYYYGSPREAKRDKDLRKAWMKISGSLGGSYVRIPVSAVMYFIDQAMAINERHYAHHEEPIRDFRSEMLRRVSHLHKAFDGLVAVGGAYSDDDYMRMVRPSKLSTYEVINYFMMRIADADITAAAHLSNLSADMLEENACSVHGITTLMRNRIRHKRSMVDDYGNSRYLCTALTSGDSEYYFSTVNISLSGRHRESNRVVLGFDVVSSRTISEFEAAMQMRQTEYISVYRTDIQPEDLDACLLAAGAAATSCEMPNGVLYMVYNSDNSHVDTDNYFINRDVFGAYLLTAVGELVLMSGSACNAHDMELGLKSILTDKSYKNAERYRFDEQIFQTFAAAQGSVFSDVVCTPDDED